MGQSKMLKQCKNAYITEHKKTKCIQLSLKCIVYIMSILDFMDGAFFSSSDISLL